MLTSPLSKPPNKFVLHHLWLHHGNYSSFRDQGTRKFFHKTPARERESEAEEGERGGGGTFSLDEDKKPFQGTRYIFQKPIAIII